MTLKRTCFVIYHSKKELKEYFLTLVTSKRGIVHFVRKLVLQLTRFKPIRNKITVLFTFLARYRDRDQILI